MSELCAWCESEHLLGRADDPGRALTDDEASAGFLAVHAECQGKMDALFSDLAARGVFVEVMEGDQ